MYAWELHGSRQGSGLEMGKGRKPYVKPSVTELTAQEVRQKLLRLVKRGDPKAKELLEKMFPEDPHQGPRDKKKSA